jgi:cellulose 1,4-beta-cellobiosidase
VTGYSVYRGTTLAGNTTTTTFTDSGLSASTQYSYTVKAYDAAGNISAASTAVTATTSAGSTGGTGPSCTATYSISSDWGSGFNANVTITNTGTTATKSWTVTWTWGGNQTITNIWNATDTQSGKAVTAINAAYNNIIAPGGSTSFGFSASYSGTNNAPTLTCTAT